MKSLIIFIFLFCLVGCDRFPEGCNKFTHRYILLKNNSKLDIYYTNDIKKDDNLLKLKRQRKLNPDSQSKFTLAYNNCWEVNFKNVNFINFYFYDASILENNKWEDVVKNNLGILDSIRVDLDYLQKNNWTVTYPK